MITAAWIYLKCGLVVLLDEKNVMNSTNPIRSEHITASIINEIQLHLSRLNHGESGLVLV